MVKARKYKRYTTVLTQNKEEEASYELSEKPHCGGHYLHSALPVICFGVTRFFNKAVSQKTEIVRVTKEIKVGGEITADMVQITEVGGYGLPENVIRQTETVVGKIDR